jgi:hypothetical protein
MTIEYRVTFVSRDTEQVTVTAANETACIAAAIRAAKRYDPKTGKRDHVITVEFWERRQ